MNYLRYILGWLKSLLSPRISCLAQITPDSKIDKRACIHRFAKVKRSIVGAYTYISNDTIFDNVRIGKFCSIADHCRVGMPWHDPSLISTSPIFVIKNNAVKSSWTELDHSDYESKPVEIGNDVWIASHVLIMGGLTIGDGAVIGAGAVVTKDVPPYAIVGGVPAKVIKYRFSKETIRKLMDLAWWNLPEATLKAHMSLFLSPSEEDIEHAISILSSESVRESQDNQ